MLYYIKVEILGEAASQVLEGIPARYGAALMIAIILLKILRIIVRMDISIHMSACLSVCLMNVMISILIKLIILLKHKNVILQVWILPELLW